MPPEPESGGDGGGGHPESDDDAGGGDGGGEEGGGGEYTGLQGLSQAEHIAHAIWSFLFAVKVVVDKCVEVIPCFVIVNAVTDNSVSEIKRRANKRSKIRLRIAILLWGRDLKAC